MSDFSDAGLIFLSLYGKTNLFFFACTKAGIDGSFSYPVAIHPRRAAATASRTTFFSVYVILSKIDS